MTFMAKIIEKELEYFIHRYKLTERQSKELQDIFKLNRTQALTDLLEAMPHPDEIDEELSAQYDLIIPEETEGFRVAIKLVTAIIEQMRTRAETAQDVDKLGTKTRDVDGDVDLEEAEG